MNELDSMKEISKTSAISYLLLWDCILNVCSTAPAELRSIYARWISENEYMSVFLVALFKMLPRDVLRNHEFATKSGQSNFTNYEWTEISSK